MSKIKVAYVTSSDFKKQENEVFIDNCLLDDGTPVKDIFDFEIRKENIKELLEVDLNIMVQAEVIQAYSQIKIPCIVEHAGLIFDDYLAKSYPGGLTKPMWNTLDMNFISETGSANRRATARAIVAYCDGKSVETFVGETIGKLAPKPKGKRKFYWDTVFIPECAETNGMTYAEIVDSPKFGLKYKVEKLSQSSKAMLKFLNRLRANPHTELWS